MLLFWLLASALVLCALGALLWPLLRPRRGGDPPDADAAAIAVFRDQKRSLDADRASGAITDAERDAALSDLACRVTEEVSDPPHNAAAASAPARAWPLAIALLLLLPLVAVVLYGRLGNPDAAVVAAAGDARELSESQITALIASLAHRLKQHPGDARGWAFLARSYYALARYAEAADAYAHAESLVKDDASLLVDYADALAMAQGRDLAGKPVALLERALAIDPAHKKALALAAAAALKARDLDQSIAYWRRLAALVSPGSDEARQIAAVIAEVDAAKHGAKASPPERSATAPRGDAMPRERAGPVAAAAAATISGRVELGSALASKVALNDTVFIFARAADGPRMPLAVLRIPARELPKDFRLDDSMAMAPGAKLSTAGPVVVEARISRSGNATPQPGDLFGRSAPIQAGTAGLRITIDQVVP